MVEYEGSLMRGSRLLERLVDVNPTRKQWTTTEAVSRNCGGLARIGCKGSTHDQIDETCWKSDLTMISALLKEARDEPEQRALVVEMEREKEEAGQAGEFGAEQGF